MKDLNAMTPEELRKHISYCEALLESKKNERWWQLVGDLASAAQRLINEYPSTKLKADPFCDCCQERIDVLLELDYLAYEDNYIK